MTASAAMPMAWFILARPREMPKGALWMMARWKRAGASGVAMRWAIASPPADCPKAVTLAGSPPNAPMLRCTQRKASSWSSSPRFPGRPLRVARKPNSPSRYVTDTTTTRFSATITAGSKIARSPEPVV